ncbi:hypothetical protein HQ865_03970 [Mucilaginibacter mali]|uniref:Uncharacterized protein n=1 Tax=Mucilaginibacter mali TaxID=2740462 RepID=A0A7D4Q8L7_9SPHI|nr:hypothetical protein [Mucilaginibacter mali]QKJ28944.1 hypothetical protein HQ865_03970 [Mucilaginibacter mali]
MKKLLYCIMALIPAYLIIQGCNKLGNVISPAGQISATRAELKVGEIDTVLAVNAKATDNISWYVTPVGFNTISTRDNAATLVFSKAGNYTVKASINGSPTDAISIKVNEAATPPANTLMSLTGDQINLVPTYYKSAHADTTYIYFTATTTKTYCASSRLNLTNSIDASGTYLLNFTNVLVYAGCSGTSSTIHNWAYFKQTPILLANGTYPLSVTLDGTTYTGTIAVTTTNVTFNWTYTSGVLIAPKVLTR